MRILTARDEAIVTAAHSGCALFGRDDLQAIQVIGRDARKFLHAMLTQDVLALAPVGAAPACLCDAQGAIVATMQVVAHEDRVRLWTDRARGSVLLEALDKFVIADDVTLELEESLALCELVGPRAAELVQAVTGAAPLATPSAHDLSGQRAWVWRADMVATASPWWRPTPRVWLQVSRDSLGDAAEALVDAGALPGSHAAREALRVYAGEPRLGADVDDGSLPLEVGLTDTVSFRKGCYLGQEAIAMMKYRGQPRRYLAWVAGVGAAATVDPAIGWHLRTGEGKRAGRLGTCIRTSDGNWRGLAVVQRKALIPGGELVAAPEGHAGEAVQLTLVASTAPSAVAPPGVAP